MGNGRHPENEDNGKTAESEKLSVVEELGNPDGEADGLKEEESNKSAQKPAGYITPPDGGWGWMVVLSSFLIHVIADGVVYSFGGIFLREFIEHFGAGRGAASWVGSLQPAVTYIVGPLSSALTNRFGCRIVTNAGALISGAGFIISMFAPSLNFLYFSAGVMTGLGFGLIYLPAIVCVAQYFEKRRSFATGLAVCGSGFGTFILAPVTEHMVNTYSWRGTFLILGGIILNILVCGLIFRPLEAETEPDSFNSEEDTSIALLSSDEKKALNEKPEGAEPSDAKQILPTGEGGKLRGEGEGLDVGPGDMVPMSNGGIYNVNENRQPEGTSNGLSESQDTKALVSSLTFEVTSPPVSTPTDLQSETETETETFLQKVSTSQYLIDPGRVANGKDLAQIAASDGALHLLQPHSASGRGAAKLRVDVHQPRRRLNSHGGSPPNTPRPLMRKDIFYSGSLLNIPMYKSHPDLYIEAVTAIPSQSVHSMEKELPEATSYVCIDLMSEMRSTLREMLSFSLLKNPVFLMFAISNFFTSIGFNMPFIFLPDRAILAGIDENRAAFLLSIIGIANTCGRVIFGFLSDRVWVNRLFLYNTALVLCGLGTAFSPVVGGDYGLLVVYAIVFGLFIGVYVSLTSVVLVDLLGLEYLTNSFGLLLLFQGAATFIGPPIAGWMYDWTGSYDISFIVMGSLIALSGAMLYVLPCVERRYNRKLSIAARTHDMELGRHKVGDQEDNQSQPMNMA